MLEAAGQWHIAAHMINAKRLYLLTKIRQLRALQMRLEEYRRRIEAVFTSHPDSGMFRLAAWSWCQARSAPAR
ncbi:MAG: hypothetical protein U1F71_22620 [Verrucomicrobiaceae bacterium]